MGNLFGKNSKRGVVWRKTGGKCWYCGGQTEPWGDFCIDHLLPASKGGDDDIHNLVPCCRGCSGRKGSKYLEEYRLTLQRDAGQTFTSEQVAYLESHGIKVPKAPPSLFYFEEKALAP